MKSFSILAALLLASGPWLCPAKLVIFGDSLSDGGLDGILSGTYLVSNHFSTGPVNVGVYPPSPYFQGRFTNGYIWVDVAAGLLGQVVDNYAAGGSNGNTGEITVDPPFAYVTAPTQVKSRSLVQQAQAYAALNAGAAASATDTVVIFTGVDEYFQQVALGTSPPNTSDVIGAISSALSIAQSAGAKIFVVVDLPPLSAFPFAATSSGNDLDTLTDTHNSQLAAAVDAFGAANSGSTISIYNVSSLFSAILAAPDNYGTPFVNVSTPARVGNLDTVQAAGFSVPVAANGDEYVFFDEVHPSKHTHQIIGQDFATKTTAQTDAAATAEA